MRLDDERVEAAPDEGRNRRSNLRHEVALPAVAADPAHGAYRCVIVDISASGMALRFSGAIPTGPAEPFATGANITLRFAPDPHFAPEHTVAFPATVQWRNPVAMGIEFKSVHEELASALQTVAEAAVRLRSEELSATQQRRSPAQRKILVDCRKTMQKQLPHILWTVRTETINRLNAAAARASDLEKSEFFRQAGLLEEKAAAITRTAELRFLKQFETVSDLDQTMEVNMVQVNAETVHGLAPKPSSLADDSQCDHDARVLTLGHSAEQRYKNEYFELEVRLANVAEHKFDTSDNPLVPVVACTIVWESIIAFCNGSETKAALQQAMQEHFIPLLGELYISLHQTLDESGAQNIFGLNTVQ